MIDFNIEFCKSCSISVDSILISAGLTLTDNYQDCGDNRWMCHSQEAQRSK